MVVEGIECNDSDIESLTTDTYVALLGSGWDTIRGQRSYSIAYWDDVEKVWKQQWNPAGDLGRKSSFVYMSGDEGPTVPCSDTTFERCFDPWGPEWDN